MTKTKHLYLNDVEVSEMTGIAVQTLRNYRFESRGPAYSKLGRSVRYPIADVVDYVERRKVLTDDCQGRG